MRGQSVLQPAPSARPRRYGFERQTLPDARRGRLYFAQAREDPALEIEALRPTARDTVVVLGSGGCTALSLLAAGAGQVVAVDVNETQNHLIELKAAAVARLPVGQACRLLGGTPCDPSYRSALYAALRRELSAPARAYWDARPRAIRRGVIDAGVSERLIVLAVWVLHRFVHPRKRVEGLLASRTLAEQREYYARVWNTRRWRLLFRLLPNRCVFYRSNDPSPLTGLENPNFAEQFLRRAEHTLTEISVEDNYFLRQMLTRSYPAHAVNGAPPYLTEPGARAVRAAADRLTLVDGSYTAYLRRCPDGSIDAFVLSNLCEWLAPHEIDDLFAEVVRTAAHGARLCFRNVVGWTEVPERWRDVVVEDRPRGEALTRRDRSGMQRRFAICRIHRERR